MALCIANTTPFINCITKAKARMNVMVLPRFCHDSLITLTLDLLYLSSRVPEYAIVRCLELFQYSVCFEKIPSQSMHKINNGASRDIN